MEETKAWQHGYPLQYLKDIEAFYTEDNKRIRSPFNQFKKNMIAKELSESAYTIIPHPYLASMAAGYSKTVSKVKSDIVMHGDYVIGVKEKGDITLSHLIGDTDYLRRELDKFTHENCWLILLPWQESYIRLAEECDFSYRGSKINTFSDIVLYYFRDSCLSFAKRKPPLGMPSELASMLQLGSTSDWWRLEILDKLEKLNLSFIDHYSNYNKGKSWSAISLRGYSPDPGMIEKPEEMNDKWHEENKDKPFYLQDTVVYQHFPMIKDFLNKFNTNVHRVRFMKLAPGGGELQRHTDQVDPDVGTKIGKLARLHFPIKTNPNVIFTTWDQFDHRQDFHFGINECWYLDTRKPHMAVNNGDEERIHLVVDLEVDQSLQDLIGIQYVDRPLTR